MHILYIHQHFALPAGSTGTRSYEFARRWINAGHKVTLIAGDCDVGGLRAGRGFVRRQAVDGIDLVIVGAKYSNKMGYVRRLASFLSYMLFSTYVGLRTKGIDVIYATSTPLTVGIPAMVIKRLKRVPFVFEVRDQWPEVPIALGVIKNNILKKLLLWLEKTIYKRSASIVALSPGMAEGVEDVAGRDKEVRVVPNGCDLDLFEPNAEGSAIRNRYQWGGKFVLLHFGTMGKVNGLDFAVDAAHRLKDRPDIHFVLIGDGSERLKLEERISLLGLGNIEILDRVSKFELVGFMAACDVSTVLLGDFPILEHNSANKFFDSLAAGKPVLLNYSGWQRKILEDNNAGCGCELCNLDEYVQKILYLHSHRKLLRTMGQNAHKLAVAEFDRDSLAARALDLVTAAGKGA
jgi:glycosyltransferase involved in cell wall biosynthesis